MEEELCSALHFCRVSQEAKLPTAASFVAPFSMPAFAPAHQISYTYSCVELFLKDLAGW